VHLVGRELVVVGTRPAHNWSASVSRQGGPVHAVLITFTPSDPDQPAPLDRFAATLAAVPGLVASTLIDDGATVGGFQVVADAAAADRYLASDAVDTMRQDVAGAAFELRRFDVKSR
jgi:hypothetical protein